MKLSTRVSFTVSAIIALFIGLGSGLWAAEVEAESSLRWGNLKTVIQNEVPEEKLNANSSITNNILQHMEVVDCGEFSSMAANRICEIRNLRVHMVGSHFQNYTEPRSITWIHGDQVKISLACEANLCLLANPTLINCATLAAQAKAAGTTIKIKLDLDSGSQTTSIVNKLKNGSPVVLTLGQSPLKSMSCVMN